MFGVRDPGLPMRTMNGGSGYCSSLSHSDSPWIWYNSIISDNSTAVVIHQTQLYNPPTFLSLLRLVRGVGGRLSHRDNRMRWDEAVAACMNRGRTDWVMSRTRARALNSSWVGCALPVQTVKQGGGEYMQRERRSDAPSMTCASDWPIFSAIWV